MESPDTTTDVFKVSIRISNDKFGYNNILADLAFRIWQANELIGDYPGVDDYMYKMQMDDKGIPVLTTDDMKLPNEVISNFIRNKFVKSHKWDKGKQSVKLKALSIRPGSLILTFTLLVVTNIMGYGGARETIDYLVNDVNEVLKFYLGKDYELTSLIEQESEPSHNISMYNNVNKNMMLDNYSRINLGFRITAGLFIIVIILILYIF